MPSASLFTQSSAVILNGYIKNNCDHFENQQRSGHESVGMTIIRAGPVQTTPSEAKKELSISRHGKVFSLIQSDGIIKHNAWDFCLGLMRFVPIEWPVREALIACGALADF